MTRKYRIRPTEYRNGKPVAWCVQSGRGSHFKIHGHFTNLQEAERFAAELH